MADRLKQWTRLIAAVTALCLAVSPALGGLFAFYSGWAEPFFQLPGTLEKLDENIDDINIRLSRLEANTLALRRSQRISRYVRDESGVVGECKPGNWCTAFITVARTEIGAGCEKPNLVKMVVINGGGVSHIVTDHLFHPIAAGTAPERVEYRFFLPETVKPGPAEHYLVLKFPCPNIDDVEIVETSEPIRFEVR